MSFQIEAAVDDLVRYILGADVEFERLLRRAPNILLIPGTASVAHLRENLAAAQLTLSPQVLAELDEIGAAAVALEQRTSAA